MPSTPPAAEDDEESEFEFEEEEERGILMGELPGAARYDVADASANASRLAAERGEMVECDEGVMVGDLTRLVLLYWDLGGSIDGIG